MQSEEERSDFQPRDLNLPSANPVFSVPLPTGLSEVQVRQLSPAALAYIGDAVYELYVRGLYLFPPKRLADYHKQVVSQVRAERQAVILRSLEDELTEDEKDLLRKGRNAASRASRRVDPEIYQHATSLEALIGYLYLTNPSRLAQLLSRLELE